MDHHHDPFRPAQPSSESTANAASEHEDHLNSMRLPDLRALADSLGMDSTGKRGDLIDRVRAHQAPAPDA